MRSTMRVVLLVSLLLPLFATANLTTVGQGTYRYLFWHLYDARLATATGQFTDYESSTPLLLELTYQREIARDAILSATIEQWQHLQRGDKALRTQWAAQLQPLLRDVKAGDSLSALLNKDMTVTFYFNGEQTGQLAQPQLAEAFFDIWLHPDTSATKLRRALIAAQ